MKRSKTLLFGYSVATISLYLSLCQPVVALGRLKDRQNLFDPIYALDDIDVQSAGIATRQSPSPIENNRAASADGSNLSSIKRIERQLTSSTLAAAYDNLDSLDKLREAARKQQVAAQQKSTAFSQAPSSLSTPDAPTPTPLIRPRQEEEPARHWSGLENYYQRMALRNTYQQQPQQPIYQVVQQEVDEPIHSYRPLSSGYALAPYATQSSADSQATKTQAFLLPIVNSAPAPVDPDFGFSVHRHSAPGISRTGGIGSGSVLLNSQHDHNCRHPVDQLVHVNDNGLVSSEPRASVEGGKVKYSEWRKLPEILFIQQRHQQQQRAKHQEDTLGELYDRQRGQEQLMKDFYCGPRNYINLQVMPATSGAQRRAVKGSTTLNYSPSQYSELQVQLGGSSNVQSLDVPIVLSAGEYPSHMGLYNGSSPADDNYLCAATLVHDRFALTLASCVLSARPNLLTLRSGEWKLNQNSTSAEDKLTQVTRQVDEVHIFPKYQNNSVEHNLALLRFEKPIDFISTPYISPACQVQSRITTRASSCWAPVRNITTSLYFDADGEGETKEKKTVNMIEQPVRLINDDNECLKQTQVKLFNFNNPNYICSADARVALWRAKLNQPNNFGSGIYCNEGGKLSLVSILHPISLNSSSIFGYLDLSYYEPWMRNVTSG